MKKYYLINLTLLLGMLVLASAQFAKVPLKLEYKLQKGHLYQLKTNTNQTITMELMGQDMAINQLIEVYQDVEVIDVDIDGNHTLEYTYKRVKLNQDAMGMQVVFDSDDTVRSENVMVQQLAANMREVVGNSVQLKIGRLGNPLSNTISDLFPQNANVTGAESGVLSVYPDKPTNIGESWEVDVVIDANMELEVQTTFTLDQITGNNAYISFEGKVENIMDQEKQLHIVGNINGTLIVDIPTGWTKSATYSQNMIMEMEEDGVRVPMHLSSITEMTTE